MLTRRYPMIKNASENVFDKTAFVNLRLVYNNFQQNIYHMKQIQNNQKSIGKSIPAYGF